MPGLSQGTKLDIVAIRLKQARLAAGLSQRELGIMAGLDPSGASTRMNQYERGKHVPNVAMLAQIGRVLSKPVAYFYTMDDRLAEFLAEYEKLPKSKKDKILEIIR